MMGWDGDAATGYSWWMAAFMLLLVAAVALGAWAMLHGDGHAGSTTVTPTPRAVLDRRLAAGEIDAETYADLRRLLEGAASRTGTGETGAGPR